MRDFKDLTGKSWSVVINVAAIKRVRSVLELDLAGLFVKEMQPLAELLDDPCKLVDVLWVLVRGQHPGITDEAFGEAMGGDCLLAASTAFMQELVDFFPGAKAKNLRKLLTQIQTAADLIDERAAQALDKLNPETLAASLTKLSTTVPASSELTPDPILSAT